MSKTIDNKVVEMSFDNSKFEKNIQTSISSLDKLKESLDFDGVAGGLDSVNASTKNCSSNVSGLSAGVETVEKKFSALEVIAITALANITNSAVEAGKRLVASLSIDQITAGFSKYEEKTTAVQTIMNATGKSIDEVNEQLEKLNWFTDETSYSFTDMVSNIGKFTSNGIDLEVSVTAMMGIANWAALSGQNAEAASRAMYNLSQSIGVGAVKLQDWKSIENANMATKEFKEIAIETAIALGTLNENAETAGGTVVDSANFSSTLSEQWFTSDVLLAALDKYGNYSEEVYKVATEEGLTAADAMKIVSSETMELGAKAFKAAQEAKTLSDAINATKDAVSSGWSTTFETIFGNYEQAKVLWTDVANELYDIFAASAEGRNELLAEWAAIGGRDILVESLLNALQVLKNVIEAVSESFHNIFPEMTAERLLAITESFRDFTERLKNGSATMDNFKKVLEGLFAIIDIGIQFFSAMFRAIKLIFSSISNVTGKVKDLTGSFFGLFVRLDETIKETDIFYKAFELVAKVIVEVINFFVKLFNTIKDSAIFTALVNIIGKAVQGIKSFIGSATEKFSTPGFDIFHKVLEGLYNILCKIGSVFSKVVNALISGFKSVTGTLSGSTFIEVLSTVWEIIVAIGQAIFGVLGEALGWLFDKLKEGDLESFLEILKTIATGGIAVGLIDLLNKLKSPFEGLGDIIENVSGILEEVRGCFEAYQTKIKADALSKIATSIAILVAAILVLSFIDADKISGGVTAIAFLLGEMVIALKLISNIGGKAGKMLSATTAMITMSLSILILAAALKKIASLDSDAMSTGLVGITALIAIMVASTKALGKDGKKVMKGAGQMIIFALAISVLASACKKLSKLSWGELGKGLVGVAALMAVVLAFAKLIGKPEKMISTGIGLIAVALAIRILASALRAMGKMSWKEMGVGLISLAGSLAALLVFIKALEKPEKIMASGSGLILIATAIRILASALKAMGQMSWKEMGVGLISLAGSLAALLVFIKALGKPQKIIAMGIGLIAVATAIRILASALGRMGGMSWTEIAKGLVALAGSLAILAVGLKAMKKSISGAAALLVAAAALMILVPALALLGAMSWESLLKALVGLAGAFVILGVAAAVLSPLTPAILALCGALALAGIAILAAGVGVSALAVGLTALSVAIGTFGASFAVAATSIVAGLAVIIEGIVMLIPTVATMIATGLIEFAKVIGEGAPIIIEAIQKIILALLDMLVTCVPQIVEVIFVLLEAVLTTLVEKAPMIVQAVFDILIACLQGIADNIGMVVQTAIDVILAFVKGISDSIPKIIQAAFDLVINFINGISDALEGNTQPLINAVTRLVKTILNTMVEILKGGVNLLVDVGKNLIEGLWEGIKSAAEWLWEGIKDIGNGIKNFFCDLFGINSPSKVFAEYGMYMDQGLAVGLTKYAGVVEDATEEVGDGAIDTMANAIAEAADIVDNGDFSEPTIRPVMDLSQIQNGANQLSRMMEDADNYNMSASVDLAGKTAKSMNNELSNDNYSAIDGLSKSIKKMADNPSQNITLTFNVSGDNPREIADEVSRIIQQQIVRKGAVWE